MKTEQPVLITSILASVDLSSSKNLFIDFNGNICGNGAKALGVLNAGTSVSEVAPVICQGIALVKSGSALSIGAKIQSDSNGKAVTFSSGEVNGFCLDSASGSDELVRVLLI